MTNAGERIVVQVDPDLKDLVPEFLRHQHDDVRTLRDVLACSDWPTVRRLGHQLRGSGGGYGFDAITDIGHRLESAARVGDGAAVGMWTDDLADYLDRVVVV
jgi:HPt (histidine-containing phosphotransfer) domain-containing protein